VRTVGCLLLGLVLTALAAGSGSAQNAQSAPCEKCHKPWIGHEHCDACTSGPTCYTGCEIDVQQNCYIPGWAERCSPTFAYREGVERAEIFNLPGGTVVGLDADTYLHLACDGRAQGVLARLVDGWRYSRVDSVPAAWVRKQEARLATLTALL
jgi:hypothetical protein